MVKRRSASDGVESEVGEGEDGASDEDPELASEDCKNSRVPSGMLAVPPDLGAGDNGAEVAGTEEQSARARLYWRSAKSTGNADSPSSPFSVPPAH